MLGQLAPIKLIQPPYGTSIKQEQPTVINIPTDPTTTHPITQIQQGAADEHPDLPHGDQAHDSHDP
ncbi:hypothetical protein IY73_00205 [Lawsonella clevelandensis]|nr:hypothetical protein IY73_00205 [Lawsonella clevelandensis]